MSQPAFLKYGYSVYYIEYLKQCIKGKIKQEFGNNADEGINKRRIYGKGNFDYKH